MVVSAHRAPAFAHAIESDHVARELVVAVPLPEDKGLRGDGRPKARRFRTQQLELGQRLVAFRARDGLTQMEVARAIGAGTASTISLWESGMNVPDGMPRERLGGLLTGRCWPELRAAIIDVTTDGLPGPWDRVARWLWPYWANYAASPARPNCSGTIAGAMASG